MRIFISIAAAASLVLSITPAQARKSLVLQSSSPWVVNYAEDSCRLIRTFGKGEDEMRLEFRMFVPGDSFWLVASGKPVGPTPTGTVKLGYRFDPDDEDVQGGFALRGKLGASKPAVMFPASLFTASVQAARMKAFKEDLHTFSRLRDDFDPKREAQVDELEINIGHRPRIAFEIGTMLPPMNAMRNCLDNLLDSWGIDAKVQKSLTRPPVPTNNPAKWITTNDYPKRMLREGLSDQVDFRLTIDATGKPTDCSVLTMEARPEFIKVTCDKLMQRARFEPALDAKGKPVASLYVSSVVWVIH